MQTAHMSNAAALNMDLASGITERSTPQEARPHSDIKPKCRMWLQAIAFAVITFASCTSPVFAENIVVEEILKMDPGNGEFPAPLVGKEKLLEELGALSIEDYKLFPFHDAEDPAAASRFVKLLSSDLGKSHICAEANKLLAQMGAEGFRRYVAYGMMQSLSPDSGGGANITGEAVIAFHIARMQFECVRPF